MWREAWNVQDPVVDEECLDTAKSSKRRGEADMPSKKIKREESCGERTAQE